MKIAFVSDQIYPRTSADAEQIVSSLSALGKSSEVTLISFCYSYSKKASKTDIEDYFGKKCTFELRFVSTLFKNIRSFEKVYFALKSVFLFGTKNFDVFYTRNIPVLIAFILFTKKRMVFESYRPWPDRNFQSKFLFKKLSKNKRLLGIITHSDFAKQSFLEAGFGNEDLLVAHNAFDIDEYNPDTEEEIRKELQIPQNKLLVTYSGRISAKKGLDRFIKLAERNPEVQFLLVGSEMRGSIEKAAEELENVMVLDWVKKNYVFSLLKASNILYIPPTLIARDKVGNTVLPLKTFIYKASGTAIFGPNSEDVSEVLSHKKTAYLVEPDNWEEEEKGFRELIGDTKLRTLLGKNASEEMLKNTWENRANEILNFIRRSISA